MIPISVDVTIDVTFNVTSNVTSDVTSVVTFTNQNQKIRNGAAAPCAKEKERV